MKLSFVLPCLNEELTIGATLRELQKVLPCIFCDYEVIVVDNGSTDDSKLIALSFDFIKVITEPVKGYGSAIRAGVRAATGDYICIFDLDTTYDLTSIPEMVLCLSSYDLVVGFREYPIDSKFPLLNRFGVFVLSRIGNILFHTRIRDWHCGLRIFRRDVGLSCSSSGMEFASEVLIRSRLYAYVNVPVDMRNDVTDRKPKLRPFSDGIRHLKLMFRLLKESKDEVIIKF